MPISKENKMLYPQNWKEISKHRRFVVAGNRCEFCGVENYAKGYWMDGEFVVTGNGNKPDYPAYKKIIRIVLTTAHLDHNPQNNDDDNLRALCQRCHLIHDLSQHIRNRRLRKLKGQLKLNFNE